MVKRIEDLTLLELYWMDCPRDGQCKGCPLRSANNRSCALELPKRLVDIRKWPIPEWLQPSLDEADRIIDIYRKHGGG